MLENKKESSIIFKNGEENRPVIYGFDNFAESMFRDQLVLFFKQLQRKLELKAESSAIFNDVYDNNIIAFIGERGSGKTSCMYSGIRIVKEAQERNEWKSVFGGGYKHLRKMRFLKTIDPSCFDTNHNILDILVGEMYRDLTKRMDDASKKVSRDDCHKLMEQFQNTKRHLHYLTSKENPYREDEELEELNYLSAGADLRDSMGELVNRFLKITDDDVLVIGIDDIDLNTRQAYEMTEQIRKYLILPQVIILLAVKLDQLGDVVRLELTKQFKDILSKASGGKAEVDPSEMAERYLNKLIPLQSRIFVPGPSSFFERRLIIRDMDGTDVRTYESVRVAVPTLIFAKCRYLFYNTRGTTSMIVPRNLRDLRMLIKMLYEMKDYDRDDKTGQSQSNKHQFKRYLFGTWLDDMEPKYKQVALSLIDEVEPTLFNKKVLDMLDSVCNIRKNKALFEAMQDVMSSDNMAYNISVGDVFHILRNLENMETSEDLRKLIFFIKSLYSIKLYEYYDELTEPEPQVTDASTENKPYRGEELEGISNYAKFVAGSLFLLEGDTLLPKENGIVEREIRNIRGRKLMTLISELVNEYDKAEKEWKATKVSNVEDDSNVKDEVLPLLTQQEYVVKLWVAEFFMLTVLRYIWTTENSLRESGIHRYRVQAKAYYDRSFDVNTESMMFNVLAPFFTLVDIEHSYNRFNGKIYKIAEKCPMSVCRQLMAHVEGDGRTFLSRSCLRNAEVLDDMFIQMQKRRGQYRMSDNMQILRNFYSFLADYQICTYDKREDGQGDANGKAYYEITFPSMGVFAKLFNDQNFALLAGSVYDKDDKLVERVVVEREISNFMGESVSMNGKNVIRNVTSKCPVLMGNISVEQLSVLFKPKSRYSSSSIKNKLLDAVKANAVQDASANQQAADKPEAANVQPVEAGAESDQNVDA